MRFFLYEIVARIVAIYLCVYCSRELRHGLVERKIAYFNVDVLVSVGSQTAFFARDATKTIPIVFIFVPDPVGSKFVMSLARPGGNATGLTHFAADLIGKRLQFLKETSPGLARVALLVNPDTEVARLYTNVTDSMAQKLGLSNHTFSARSQIGR